MNEDADRCRRRLVEINAELWALPADALARKFELRSEADSLRRELAGLVADEIEESKQRWSARSARKGSHAEPDPAEQAARIVSPIEGGGGLGAG